MTEQIHIGDIGTVFKVLITDENGDALNISTATTKQIIFRKPGNRGTLTVDADFTTDGSDGYIQYAIVDGDLDTFGVWQIQAKVITPQFTNYSEIDDFRVRANNT